MTSRLNRVTYPVRIALHAGVMGLVLTGCTGLPPEQRGGVQQVLDEQTGTTVTRLAKPLELTVTVSPGPAKDPFAYLSPFQTNRMGQRADFVWLAVPADGALAAAPVIRADGEIVQLGKMSASPELAELKTAPYRTPAPWSQQFFAIAPDAAIAQLAAASRIEITSRDAGGEWHFILEGSALAALTSYAATR